MALAVNKNLQRWPCFYHHRPWHAISCHDYELTVQTIFGRHKANTSDASKLRQSSIRIKTSCRWAAGIMWWSIPNEKLKAPDAVSNGTDRWKAPHFQTFPVQVSVSQAQRKMNIVEVVLFRVHDVHVLLGYKLFFGTVLKASSGTPCVPMPECIWCEPWQNFALVACQWQAAVMTYNDIQLSSGQRVYRLCTLMHDDSMHDVMSLAEWI